MASSIEKGGTAGSAQGLMLTRGRPVPTTLTRKDMLHYTHWAASKECEKMFMDYLADRRKLRSSQSRSHFWHGLVPVATYNTTANGSPLVPTKRRITQLRAIPMQKDSGQPTELLISPSGRPIYAAYAKCPDGKVRVHQLFDFAITAPDAGEFVPIPFDGEHCPGQFFRIEYERRKFCGTVHNLLLVFTLKSKIGGTNAPPHPPSADARLLQATGGSSPDTRAASGVGGRRPQPSKLPTLEQPQVARPRRQKRARAVDAGDGGDAASERRVAQSKLQRTQQLERPRQNKCVREGTEAYEAAGVGQSKPTLELQWTERPLQNRATRQTKGKEIATVEKEQMAPQMAPKMAPEMPSRCHPCFPCESCKRFWGGVQLPVVQFFLEDGTRDLTKFLLPPEEDVPPPLQEGEDDEETKRRKRALRKGPKSRSSRYRGVNRFSRIKSGYWETHIWYNRKQHFLGASATKELAARAFDKAAIVFHDIEKQDLNFKATDYKEEYPFLFSLTMAQMEIYLRREAAGDGEEVNYPGVKPIHDRQRDELSFEAYYQHGREADTREHVQHCATEEEAVRIAFQAALSRKDYALAAKILDTHHIRTVRPAALLDSAMSQDPPTALIAPPAGPATGGAAKRGAAELISAPQPAAVHEPALEFAPATPAEVRKPGQRGKAKASQALPPVIVDATPLAARDPPPLAMAAPQPAQKAGRTPAKKTLYAALLPRWQQESETAHESMKTRRSERLLNSNLKKKQLAEIAQHEELATAVYNFTVHPVEEVQRPSEAGSTSSAPNAILELQPADLQSPSEEPVPSGLRQLPLESTIRPLQTVVPRSTTDPATTTWLQLRLKYWHCQIQHQQWQLQYHYWQQYLQTFQGPVPAAILLKCQQWQLQYHHWLLKYHERQLENQRLQLQFCNSAAGSSSDSFNSQSPFGCAPPPEQRHAGSTVTDLLAPQNSRGDGLPVMQASPTVPFTGTHGPSEIDHAARVAGPSSEVTTFTQPEVARSLTESPASVNRGVNTVIRPQPVRPSSYRFWNLSDQ